MRATILYRLASVFLIVFAAANTLWLVYFWRTAAANAPHFPFGHSDLTYVQVVLALEVFCSLCILFGAYLSWHLGSLARRIPQAIGALGWALLAFQAARRSRQFVLPLGLRILGCRPDFSLHSVGEFAGRDRTATFSGDQMREPCPRGRNGSL
jgi:hypothetical protein